MRGSGLSSASLRLSALIVCVDGQLLLKTFWPSLLFLLLQPLLSQPFFPPAINSKYRYLYQRHFCRGSGNNLIGDVETQSYGNCWKVTSSIDVSLMFFVFMPHLRFTMLLTILYRRDGSQLSRRLTDAYVYIILLVACLRRISASWLFIRIAVSIGRYESIYIWVLVRQT